MYTLKGFMSFGPLADNAVNVIAPHGELSTHCTTYSKEKGQYTNNLFKDCKLVSFKSQQVTDNISTLIPVPVLHQDKALAIGQFIYNSSNGGDFTSNQARCLDLITTEYTPTIYNVEIGPMVTDGVRWMPEWLTYSMQDPETNFVRIWFADQAFSSQYDEYEIDFITAISPVDNFFKDPLLVKADILARSVTEMFNRIELVKNKNPYTYLINDVFDYIAAADRTFIVPTNWVALIWGPVGNNPDIIKQELAKHILAQSAHPVEEWMVILPDIFTSTEFIITPLWDQYSVPNRTIITGVYSPTTNLLRGLSLAYATSKGVGYNRDHVNNNLSMSGSIYKSLAFMAIGGPYNRDQIYSFEERWVDYMMVPSNSPDYNRMNIETQNWVELFTRMLIVAEYMTRYSDIPTGMARVIRGGVMYITASFKNVLYLVVSRQSLIDITTDPEEFPWVEPLNIFLVTDSFNDLSNEQGDPLIGG